MDGLLWAVDRARGGGWIVAFALTAFLVACEEPVGASPPPTPTATAAPSESAVASPSLPAKTPAASPTIVGWAWEVNEFPGGPARGAAWIDDRWVALDGLDAWSSLDGVVWQPARVDATPQEADGQMNLGPVASLGNRSYAVGMWYGPFDAIHPVVWESEDGTTWSQVVPDAPWGYMAYDVAGDGTRLAVAGTHFDFGDGRVWTSSDGANWTEHTSDGGPATMHAIHGDADGFVAVGFRLGAGESRLPAIWHSGNGDTWTDAALPAADGPLTLLDVARLPGGRYVALGIRATETESGGMVTWFADDPLAWKAGAELAGGLVPGRLLATSGGMLMTTGALDGPMVRFSTDGVTWSEAASFPLPDVVTRVSAVATDGVNVILLGGTDEGDAHFVWLGRPVVD